MNIEYHRLFRKRYKRLDRPIKNAFRERLKLFLVDKYHPIFNNHPLLGQYAGKRSFNVTGDYRVIFWESDDTLTLYLIGTHSELYGK